MGKDEFPSVLKYLVKLPSDFFFWVPNTYVSAIGSHYCFYLSVKTDVLLSLTSWDKHIINGNILVWHIFICQIPLVEDFISIGLRRWRRLDYLNFVDYSCLLFKMSRCGAFSGTNLYPIPFLLNLMGFCGDLYFIYRQGNWPLIVHHQLVTTSVFMAAVWFLGIS